MYGWAYLLLLFLIVALCDSDSISLIDQYYLSNNPFRLLPPKCNNPTLIHSQKVSQKKFLVGVMFKDEEGFLAEYIAYYKYQGFDHMILWDHGSSDNYRVEIEPWLATNFVEIRNVSTLWHHPSVERAKGSKFTRTMAVKKETERQNIIWGLKNGYDYYLTADIDEYAYAYPSSLNIKNTLTNSSVVLSTLLTDAIDAIYHPSIAPTTTSTTKDASISTSVSKIKKYLYLPIAKLNFPAHPHVHEPVHLLQIEAYLTRFAKTASMNFYMNVQPKFVYRLSGDDISAGNSSNAKLFDSTTFNEYYQTNFTDYQVFLSSCCYFHGCDHVVRNDPTNICVTLGKLIPKFGYETKHLSQYMTDRTSFTLRMNHYARSFEKFGVKAQTWETANHISSSNYELKEFLTRSFGWIYDSLLSQLGCAVRQQLVLDDTRQLQSKPFIRFGNQWKMKQFNAPVHHSLDSQMGSVNGL